MDKNIAIVLAAGSGSRMGTTRKKQYLLLNDKPMLYYSLHTFEESKYITDIILVVGAGEEDYVREEIVKLYSFQKVREIVHGGKERYHSVHAGIQAISTYITDSTDNCHVWIHDGARPFITEKILERLYGTVKETKACVTAMPVKDTIKIADGDGYISTTPNRNLVWQIQTPQVFAYDLVREAYETLLQKESTLAHRGIAVTDDAMVVETFTNQKVKLVEGDYRNIKITTPEDLQIADIFYKAD